MGKVVFNLFEPDTVLGSLAMCFGIEESLLGEYLLGRHLASGGNMDTIEEAELFLERFNIDVNNVDDRNIYLRLKHVTTSTDELRCLRENGLRDLKFMLQEPTPLNQFLKDNGIEINVDERIIKIDGVQYPIFKSEEAKELCTLQCSEEDCYGCKYKERTNRLWLKLYKYRCEIEAFSRGDNEKIEGYSCVNRNPEILWNLDEIIKYLGQDTRLERNWHQENNNKFYVIDFEVSLSNLNQDVDNKIIKFLAECIEAFCVSSSDIYVAINEGVSVPFNEFISITEK